MRRRDDPGDELAHDDDGFLAARARAGDRQAFDRLVRRYREQVVSISLRLLGNAEDAQEVTQDAFLKAYTGLHELHRPEAFGGWLMRIASNLALNRRRGKRLRQAADLDEVMEANGGSAEVGVEGGPRPPPDPARVLAGQELGERVRDCLARLPEKQRTALVLFTLEGRSQREIADALNLSVEAVKWHVFQGRKKLKEWLGDDL